MNLAEEEALETVGLHAQPPTVPEPMKFPRIVGDGDQIFLRCVVDGVDRECEVSIGVAFNMLIDLTKRLASLARR